MLNSLKIQYEQFNKKKWPSTFYCSRFGGPWLKTTDLETLVNKLNS